MNTFTVREDTEKEISASYADGGLSNSCREVYQWAQHAAVDMRGLSEGIISSSAWELSFRTVYSPITSHGKEENIHKCAL